jgi:uncharacterized membrane protein
MKLRVWLLTAVVILANLGGNVILKQAMLHVPPQAGLIASILTPVAILGIFVLSVWMLLRMWLLGMADLSFVVPVSAVGYVLSAFAGAFFFHERVPARGWVGTVLIMLGAVLTGLTEHNTPPSAPSTSHEPRPKGAVASSTSHEPRPKGAVASSSSDPRPSGAFSAPSETQP